MARTERGENWELHYGRWQECDLPKSWDVLITDPPYSDRTHGNHRSMEEKHRRPISYDSISMDDLAPLFPRTMGWACVINSHDNFFAIEKIAQEHGRYVFQPIPIVSIGGRVRLAGDGPSSWAVYMFVSRPRTDEFRKWGTLPGAYIERGSAKGAPIIGKKKLETMRAIVRDYSREGDLVCDPYAGTGTTLLAAVMEGRRAVGAECDRDTFDFAVRRLRAFDQQLRLPGVVP